MPRRGPTIDPFELKEGSVRIPTSICVPKAWLEVIRRHAHTNKVSISQLFSDAVEAHAKTIDLKLPEVIR